MTLRIWLSVAGVAVIAVLLAAVYGKGLSHGVNAERRKAEAAEMLAKTAMIETELARRAAARVDAVARRQAGSAELARAHSTEAQNAPDADEPLDDERAARLRNADRQLCELAPSIDGCASTR